MSHKNTKGNIKVSLAKRNIMEFRCKMIDIMQLERNFLKELLPCRLKKKKTSYLGKLNKGKLKLN